LEAKESVSDGAQQEELGERLRVVEEEHATALQNAQTEHETALNKIQEESAAVRENVELEVSSRFNEEKTKLADQLETQARQHAEENQEMRKSMEAHVDQMGAKGLKAAQEKYSANLRRRRRKEKVPHCLNDRTTEGDSCVWHT
jgi:hypothetical protein